MILKPFRDAEFIEVMFNVTSENHNLIILVELFAAYCASLFIIHRVHTQTSLVFQLFSVFFIGHNWKFEFNAIYFVFVKNMIFID